MLEYTKQELESLHKERLEELIKYAGGPSHTSKMIKVSTSTVQGWLSRGRISIEGVDKVQRNKKLKDKFTLSYLRPELTYEC